MESRGVVANHLGLWSPGPRFESARDYAVGGLNHGRVTGCGSRVGGPIAGEWHQVPTSSERPTQYGSVEALTGTRLRCSLRKSSESVLTTRGDANYASEDSRGAVRSDRIRNPANTTANPPKMTTPKREPGPVLNNSATAASADPTVMPPHATGLVRYSVSIKAPSTRSVTAITAKLGVSSLTGPFRYRIEAPNPSIPSIRNAERIHSEEFRSAITCPITPMRASMIPIGRNRNPLRSNTVTAVSNPKPSRNTSR